MIDLHTHTDESDGTLSPEDLVRAALAEGVTTLAITDHDTFAGWEKAVPFALERGLDLIRGIELNTRHEARNIHLLAYFPDSDPSDAFLARLRGITDARRARNREMIERLQSLGVAITLAEVEAVGRSLTGRPHFARVLVKKGYAADRDEAFQKFIGETAACYVERDSPTLREALELVEGSGGIASLAHPIRLGKRSHSDEEQFLAGLRDIGLRSFEVFHSDHAAQDIERYQALARRHGFAYTGGSDFHGDHKPRIRLGHAATGTIPIPESAMAVLKER